MNNIFVFAFFIGLLDAFKVDYLIAMGNIVTDRGKIKLAARDGILWGTGFALAIFLLHSYFIINGLRINVYTFIYLQIIGGIALSAIGFYRIFRIYVTDKGKGDVPQPIVIWVAAFIGFALGLPASEKPLLFILERGGDFMYNNLFLLTYCVGVIVGMIGVGSFLGFPFSNKVTLKGRLRRVLITLLAVTASLYGLWLVVKAISTLP